MVFPPVRCGPKAAIAARPSHVRFTPDNKHSSARPDEFGPGEGAAQITGSVDISVKSLEELADKLGA
jgi:hypothetical protein